MAEWEMLFNGQDLGGWRGLNDVSHEWLSAASVALHAEDSSRFRIEPGNGLLVNGSTGKTANLITEKPFGSCELHIEFLMPKGSNSGVYFMGRYEIQVLDSWGATELKYGTCGGIYCRWTDEQPVGGTPPRINASRPPGEWQSFDVRFTAPVFDAGGTKTAHARFHEVAWNGELIHEGVEVEGPTRAGMAGPEVSSGPLMLQGDHGPVAYRNIRIRAL